ncbi:MAG: calcium-binding protein [Solirubrobacteraceae bacterium]|nr:calcium-binding protein [Solirubrobacteraceae bacterium]
MPFRSRRTVVVAGTLALACGAAAQPAAAEETARVTRAVPSGSFSPAIVIDALQNKTNKVEVKQSGDRVLVTDGRIGIRAPAGGGCTQSLVGFPPINVLAECSGADVSRLYLYLRENADTATNDTDVPATAYGEAGDDVLLGGSAFDRLYGGTGRDTLNGRDRDDNLFGQEDDDILLGENGDDELEGGLGRDEMNGGPGADVLLAGLGADVFRGGSGGATPGVEPQDIASYRAADGPLEISLDDVANDGYSGEGDNVRSDIEWVIGGQARDVISGTARGDVIDAQAGDDIVYGNDGDDQLYGQAGANQIIGGVGEDRLFGGAEKDILRGDAGDDYFEPDRLGAGTDVVTGGSGSDTVSYLDHPKSVRVDFEGDADDGGPGENDRIDADVENAIGGGQADTLVGDARANSLTGGGGADRIEGGPGADSLIGEPGDDTILARDGEIDRITCGAGNDTVIADRIDEIPPVDCERVEYPVVPVPVPVPVAEQPVAPAGGSADPVAVGGGGGSVVAAAPRACPAVRVAVRRATVSRKGVVRIPVTGRADGAAVACDVRVTATAGRQLGAGVVRIAPGGRAVVSVRLNRAARKRLSRGRLRATVRIQTVDPSGRVANAQRVVRLVAPRV